MPARLQEKEPVFVTQLKASSRNEASFRAKRMALPSTMIAAGSGWATAVAQEFKGIDLGDARLDQRTEILAKALGCQPGQSIPQACGDWASTQGAYRFFANDKVSREALLQPHVEHSVGRCRAEEEALAIQDTTYLNFTHLEETEGLGPIGTAKGLKGLVVHNTVAVGLSGEFLGFLHQEAWAREGRKPCKETAEERRQRERESQSWTRGLEGVRKHGLGRRVIHVMDREGDIYEVLDELVRHEERFVIRACRNRLLAGEGEKEYLFETVRRSPAMGTTMVKVPARPGQKKREATLTVRRAALVVRPPKALGRKGLDLTIAVVEAHEENPPKGCAALTWVLLTLEPSDTLEDCLRVIKIYTRRWKIEELHMGLKTGCDVEGRQLQTRERLEAFLGFASVISVMLLRLRDAARQGAAQCAVLSEAQLALLRNRYPDIGSNPTAREMLRGVARLGGFLARKGDGEPGWRTLWRGMDSLLIMEHGYRCAMAQRCV